MVGTCNVAKCGQDNAIELFDCLQRVVKGVLLLQEVATWSDGHEFEIDGWSIFHTSSNPSAVAVPHCLGQMVGGYETASMCCGIILDTYGIISAYLPDSSKTLSNYMEEVEALKQLCKTLQEKGAKELIIGGDLQLEIQANLQDVTGPCANGRVYINEYWERHAALVDLALTFKLSFANTWLENEACFNTRSHWSLARSQGSQIDYLLVPHRLQTSSGIHPHRILRSDHYLVWSAVRTKDIEINYTRGLKTFTGWTPTGAHGVLDYRQIVAEELNSHSGADTCLRRVSEAVQGAAAKVSHSVKSGQQSAKCPDSLRQAEQKRVEATNVEEKKKWRAIAQRERRKWKAALALTKSRKKRKSYMPIRLRCEDQLTCDRARWASQVLADCERRYTNTNITPAEVAKLRSNLQASGTQPQFCWNMSITVAARAKLKKETVAGGGSMIVPEMLLALSWLQLEIINTLFVKRFQGSLVGEPESWRQLIIVFIAKCQAANEMVDFRGICLIDVFAKWYMQGIMMMLRKSVKHLPVHGWNRLMMLGFEPNHCTAQIITSLNVLLTKGAEWNGRYNVVIGAADVRAAFDNLSLQSVFDALKYWGFAPELIRALLEESLDLEASARFPGISPTPGFRFNRSVRQGGVESPWEWNAVMRHLLSLLVPSWEGRGFGIDVPYMRRLTHLVWADNLYFVGSSVQQVQSMMQEFTDKLVAAGMSWKAGSLKIMHATSLEHPCEFVLNQRCETINVEAVETLEVLGAELSKTGSSITLLEHRLAQATSCFYALKDCFLCRDVPVQQKFMEFQRRVQPVALFAAEAVAWSQTCYNLILRWENMCLRRMCMFRHHPGKTFVENVRDTTHRARKWFHKRGHKSTATLLLERQHKLIGASFARLAVDIGSKVADQEPENLVAWPYPGDIKARKPSFSVVALSLLWKSQAWWTDEQAVMTVIDATNVSGWRHTRPGRQCLWERHFVKTFGEHWMRLAIKGQWKDRLSQLVHGAYDMLGMKTLEARYGCSRKKNTSAANPPRKKQRFVQWEPQEWITGDAGHRDPKRLELCGDSLVVVNWLNGVWPAKFTPYAKCIERIHLALHSLVHEHGVRPRLNTSDFCRHFYREHNERADQLAKQYCHSWSLMPYVSPANYIRACFDGSRTETKASFGWVVYAAQDLSADLPYKWTEVAAKSWLLPADASITAAELEGASDLIAFLQSYYEGYDTAAEMIAQHNGLGYNFINVLRIADLV